MNASNGVRSSADLEEIQHVNFPSTAAQTVVRRSTSHGTAKPTAVPAPTTVVIQVGATSSGRWTDETCPTADTIDCAVHVALQGPQEVKRQAPPAKRTRRWWTKQCLIAVIVLGCMMSAIMVPYSLVVGFSTNLPGEFKLLTQPAPSHRIIFAFSGNSVHATPDRIMPVLAKQVSQWTVLASSGVHVAAFASRQAMQKAMAVLANTTDIKYAVADFQLLPDRHANSISNPTQLQDLSRLQQEQRRQLQAHQHDMQEQQQQLNGNCAGNTLAFVSGGLEGGALKAAHVSKLVATHTQRLAQRKARRQQLLLSQPSLASIGLPATAQNLRVWNNVLQQESQSVKDPENQLQQQQQQQHSSVTKAATWTQHLQLVMNKAPGEPHEDYTAEPTAAAAAAGVSGGTLRAEGSSTPGEYANSASDADSAGWADVTFATASATASQEAAAGTGQFSGTAAAAAAVASAGQLLAFQTQRRLQQYQSPPPPPQPQPQQRQALIHPQKGGKGVAWYLTDAGLHMRQAWNTSYGLDDMLIAVVDSGVELSQGGVGASVWINGGEVVGDNIDNDGNGFVDDVMGWDFGGSCADAACSYCTPGPDPTDTTGWGTHAASVIAAQPEVTTGASGIAPGVRVMALKVSDCRAGSVLGDTVAQQLKLAPHSQTVDVTASLAAPVLLGSAAVEAIDYALLNGAHIVLAAWQAGGLIDSVAHTNSSSALGGGNSDSSSSRGGSEPVPRDEAASKQGEQQQELNCVLGGASAAEANATINCLAAAQTLLFQDVLHPLEEAGVLVVTMYPDEEDSSGSVPPSNGTHAPAPVLPCSLGLEFSNVICVGSSRSAAASTEAIASDVSAQLYFDGLINTLSADTPSLGDLNSTDSNSTNSTEDDVALPDYFSNASDEPLHYPDQETNTITDVTGVVRTLLSHNPVQLRAPGTNILSGWAWGSHAVVSGGSAAAAVAAGAAALTWSNLGQTLGADATGAAAVEGLAKLVKHMLIEGSGKPGGSSSNQSAGTSAGVLMEQGVASASSGGRAAGELKLLETLQMSSSYKGPLRLKAAHIGPAVTAVSNTLSYSWHISSLDSGPFNTPAMSFVARKSLNHEAPFPLRDWEFFGYTALVEVEGYVVVPSPGNYSVAVVSEDKFILWLQGKWLRMEMVGAAGPAMGLDPRAWTATVLFGEPGYYHLRIIIYMPSLSPFDVLWQPPGSASFVHIPHFASFGRAQPVPLQLADQITGHMLVHGSRARSRGSSATSSRISSEYSGSAASSVVTSTVDGSSVGSVVVKQQPNVTSEPGNPANAVHSDGFMQPDPASGPMHDSSSNMSDTVQTDPLNHDGMDTAATTAVAAETPEDQQEQQQQQSGSSDYSSGWGGAYMAPSYGSSSGWGGWGGGSNGWGSSFGNFFDMLFPGFGWSTEKGKGPATDRLPDENEAMLHSSLEYDRSGEASSRDGSSSRSSSNGAMRNSSDASLSGNSSAGNSTTGMQDSSQDAMPPQQQQQQPPWHPSRLRSLFSTHWINPIVDKQVVAPLPGVFSVAMTLEEPWAYRTIIPSLTNLNLRRTAMLSGYGLSVADGSVLQQQLFGQIDPLDDRSGYGVIQGWLSWESLNPSSLQWLQGPVNGLNLGSNSVNPSSHNGEWGVLDGVQASSAGVQFELTCGGAGVQQGCSLHVDGLVVAGSLGQTTYSTCILPARRPFGSSSTDASAVVPEQLLHLELLFATDAVRLTTLAVRSRPCLLGGDGIVQVPSSSDGSFKTVTAAAGVSALGVDSAAIASLGDADVSGGYLRGMACTVRATVPASAADSSGGSKLEKLVFLTAEEMQQTVASSYNLTAVEEQLTNITASTTAVAAAAANSSEGSSSTDSKSAAWPGNSTDGTTSVNATADANSTNSTHASSEYAEWMPEVDTHAEATAKAVLGVKGITVAELAPQWVASLPADTTYSFTCGCYWNGSWEGNVAVGVRAGSSGTAALYLAGWPVDVEHLLPQYGQSDIYTPDYSTWQQRQQLALGGNAADPINWAGDSPGRGLGLIGLGVASDPTAAAKLGHRPKQLLDGRVFTLGQVNGVRNLVVSPGSGWHQLLVVQGEGLQAWGSVVVVADVAGAEDISSSNSSRPYAATKQGWLPGQWDAWVPR